MSDRNYYIWDLEVFSNCFVFGGKFRGADKIEIFEISDRRNDREALLSWLSYLQNTGVEMVGFNSLAYDYHFIHEIFTNPYLFTYQKAYELSQQIITSQKRQVTLSYIKVQDRFIPQIDIVKYCHFDNESKRTSLKALQFAMRSPSVEDLPFDFKRSLNDQEKDKLIAYNKHDITETEKFFGLTEHAVDMRREYLEDGTLRGDVLNYSDVKIGEAYLVERIGRNKCYSGSKPRGTFRTVVEFNKIILPKINFRTEPFQAVLSWFKSQTLYLASEEKKPSLAVKLAGLDFHFGIGGVHASAENKIFHSDDNYQIIDIDVAGMYVAVAIANGFAPEHLGGAFSTAYRAVKEDRGRYKKGTAKNSALKLAGNGVYGKSNSPFSPFFDPNYTFTVTVNGQLQLLQAVELISLIPECELIQANTDGITVRILKDNIPFFDLWCKEWEQWTGLELERVLYSRMWIANVNSYIAEKMNGELKLKGDGYWYPATIEEYDGWWNKDFSNMASTKIAIKAMTDSWPLEIAVRLITDPFDFMLRYKATGESKVFIGDEEQLKTVRYYISVSGQPMKKVAPPTGEIGQYKRANKLKDSFFDGIMKEIGRDRWDERIHTKNKSKYAIAETTIQKGYLIKQCNLASKFDFADVDWKFYIEEAKKLIVGSK